MSSELTFYNHTNEKDFRNTNEYWDMESYHVGITL